MESVNSLMCDICNSCCSDQSTTAQVRYTTYNDLGYIADGAIVSSCVHTCIGVDADSSCGRESEAGQNVCNKLASTLSSGSRFNRRFKPRAVGPTSLFDKVAIRVVTIIAAEILRHTRTCAAEKQDGCTTLGPRRSVI